MKTSSSTPDAILQTAFGFWNSRVLLTAVTFDLFTTIGQRKLTGAEIGKKLDLHPRGVADFLDALVAMKFLEREGAQVLVEPIATWVAYLMYQAKAHARAKWPVTRRPEESTN